MGPNLKRLAIRFSSARAVPVGGGIGDAIKLLADPKKLAANLQAGIVDAHAAIAAVKAAPDNPFGTDDEVIAAELLRLAAERDRAQRASPAR